MKTRITVGNSLLSQGPSVVEQVEAMKLRYAVGLLASGLEAAEGAQVTIEAMYCNEARDPCNNDNYSRLFDWITEVRLALEKLK